MMNEKCIINDIGPFQRDHRGNATRHVPGGGITSAIRDAQSVASARERPASAACYERLPPGPRRRAARHAPPAPAPHAGSTARCTPSRPAATTCHRCSLTHRTNIDVFCQEFVRSTGPAGVARTARRGEPVLRAASRICLGGFLRAPATRHLQRRVLRKVRAARPCHIANMLMTSVSLASLYF